MLAANAINQPTPLWDAGIHETQMVVVVFSIIVIRCHMESHRRARDSVETYVIA